MNEPRVIVAELERASRALDERDIRALVEAVKTHDRIFVYATGRSGLMCRALAMRLMQLGLRAFVVGETTTPSVQQGDLLIVASASGETESVVSTARTASRQGVDVFAVSATVESGLSQVHQPDILIQSGTKIAQSAISVQPLGSLFEQMLLVYFDAVVLHLASEGEGSNDAMAHRHASLE